MGCCELRFEGLVLLLEAVALRLDHWEEAGAAADGLAGADGFEGGGAAGRVEARDYGGGGGGAAAGTAGGEGGGGVVGGGRAVGARCGHCGGEGIGGFLLDFHEVGFQGCVKGLGAL